MEWRPLRLFRDDRAAAARLLSGLSRLMAAGRQLAHGVLATRPGHAARRFCVDGWWTLRGLVVRNPPLPAAPRQMLFVCKGNICRSPFAAAVAGRLLQHRGIACLSAGFQASPDRLPPDAAVAAAGRRGVHLGRHRAVLLSAGMMAAADVVVVMEHRHFVLLRRRYPAFRDRIVLLPLFSPPPSRPAGYARLNIADPYGKSNAAFDRCYADIDAAVRQLIGRFPPAD